MAQIFQPRWMPAPWRARRDRVQRSHESLWDELVVAAPWWEAAPPVDLISGRRFDYISSPPTFEVGEAGRGMVQDSSSDGAILELPENLNGMPFPITVAWYGWGTGTASGNFANIFGLMKGFPVGSIASPFYIAAFGGRGTSDTRGVCNRNDSRDNGEPTSISAGTLARPTLLLATFRDGEMDYWYDNDNIVSVTGRTAGDPVYAASNSILFGTWNTEVANAVHLAGYVWNRELTAPERTALWHDPLAVVRPDRRIFVPGYDFAPVTGPVDGWTFDAKTEQTTVAQTSHGFSHSHGALTDGLVVVKIMHDTNTAPTAVTWDGNAMTLADSQAVAVTRDVYIYYYATGDIAAGSKTLAVTSALSGDYAVVCETYSGIDQTTPLRNAAKTSGSSATSASVAPTSVADDLVVDAIALAPSVTSAETVGAGQTETTDELHPAGASYALWGSREIGSDTSTTMSWSWTGSGNYGIVAAAFRPATSLVTGTLAATLPSLTAALTATTDGPYAGTLAGTLPALTAALTATTDGPYTGTLSANFPSLTASLSATLDGPYTGTLAANLPSLTAALSGTFAAWLATGTLNATLPSLTAALSGTLDGPYTGTLSATLPSLTASLVGSNSNVTGTLAATLPSLTASLSGSYQSPVVGTLNATLPSLIAALVAQSTFFLRRSYVSVGASTRNSRASVGQNTRSTYVSVGQNTRNT